VTDRAARVAILAAAGWAIIVLAATCVLPFVSVAGPRTDPNEHLTLAAYAGWPAVAAAAVLLVMTAVAGVLVMTARRQHRRWAAYVARGITGIILLAGVAGFLTFFVGLFIVPIAGLLICAMSTNQRSPPPPRTQSPSPNNN
jgi:NADH:ubiquinone oxidoreductase subunit 2 (subunit N)